MDNFDKEFEKSSKKFDRDFRRIRIFGCIAVVFWTFVYLSLIGFGIWAIVMLMQFWGVV